MQLKVNHPDDISVKPLPPVLFITPLFKLTKTLVGMLTAYRTDGEQSMAFSGLRTTNAYREQMVTVNSFISWMANLSGGWNYIDPDGNTEVLFDQANGQSLAFVLLSRTPGAFVLADMIHSDEQKEMSIGIRLREHDADGKPRLRLLVNGSIFETIAPFPTWEEIVEKDTSDGVFIYRSNNIIGLEFDPMKAIASLLKHEDSMSPEVHLKGIRFGGFKPRAGAFDISLDNSVSMQLARIADIAQANLSCYGWKPKTTGGMALDNTILLEIAQAYDVLYSLSPPGKDPSSLVGEPVLNISFKVEGPYNPSGFPSYSFEVLMPELKA